MLIFFYKNCWKGEKLPTFSKTIFSSEKCECFVIFCQKKWKGWSHNLETFHEENLNIVEKKPRKRKNYGCNPSLWILIFKIYKYLPIFFQARICRHIFELWLLIENSTRPPNLLQLHCSKNVMMVDYGY